MKYAERETVLQTGLVNAIRLGCDAFNPAVPYCNRHASWYVLKPKDLESCSFRELPKLEGSVEHYIKI
jgi:hypothetical protein